MATAFDYDASTVMLTGVVDGVETKKSVAGWTLRSVVATFRYGGGRKKQATVSLGSLFNGPGPADGKSVAGTDDTSQLGLQPLRQTIIRPGQPVTLYTSVDPARAGAAAIISAAKTQRIIEQADYHRASAKLNEANAWAKLNQKSASAR